MILTKFTCERCGESETFEQKKDDDSATGYPRWQKRSASFIERGGGFSSGYEEGSVNGQLLCPSCVEKYKQVLLEILLETNRRLCDFFKSSTLENRENVSTS